MRGYGIRMARPVLFRHASSLRHDTGTHPPHPERPARIVAVTQALEAQGWLGWDVRESPAATADQVHRVHPPDYTRRIEAFCAAGGGMLDVDTVASPGSWEAALLSAGGAVAACDAVVSGKASSAFVCTRPPGHHAEADQAMGFCLFNNVAVAARYLQDEHRLGRVLIVDWDVHHGNGTQHMFEDDDTVFYFSTHQYPFYPGTGSARETGSGRGAGYTLNYPMLAGSGDEEYVQVFREVLRPEIDRVQPEAILISAGFDAHRSDPLAGMAVTEKGYSAMTAILKEAADKHCGGRIVSLLEGGYDLAALGASVEAHLRALGAFGE